MSFDIFLQCFRNGEPEQIPRELFESIFLPHATHPDAYKKDTSYMTVEYPDGSGASIYCGGDSAEERSNIMFNHCGGNAFSEDMYKLAHLTRSIIYWPSENPIYLYTDPTVPGELKGMEYFEEARAVLIHNGAAIGEAIASN
ncbi:MAG TPA: hypothetical protein VG328_11890 [Stellaceae bacterium]|jgi:hypothetical protein|nr:hypothetical protein [Stellaceae bacterium]